ncbi:hypothetical protein J1TS5_17380 [Paenibacillus macerans]|nr:hypothetical protein J1TS5_17380 [Paenibacillus macerans]
MMMVTVVAMAVVIVAVAVVVIVLMLMFAVFVIVNVFITHFKNLLSRSSLVKNWNDLWQLWRNPLQLCKFNI